MDILKIGEAVLDPGLQWINFFNGRLLSGEDLTQERNASTVSRQRLGQAVGDGIVWGLQVIPKKLNSAVSQDLVVTVKPGLAVNRNGRPLALEEEATVWLLPADTTQAATVKSSYFAPCLGVRAGGYTAGGVYLLTLFPAEGPSQELAPVSGLGTTTAACMARYRKEGIQFRMLPVDPKKQLGLTDSDLTDAEAGRLRNRLAYAVFGMPVLSAPAEPFNPLDLPFDPLDFLRSDPTNPLTDCDVPLAIVYLTDSGGMQFVDMGSVRRRVSLRPAGDGWGVPSSGGDPARLGDRWTFLFGERRLSLAEAFFLEFEEHVLDLFNQLAIKPALAHQDLSETFVYLPAIGIVPIVGGGSKSGFNQADFFGSRAPGSPTVISQADLVGLFQKALAYSPVQTSQVDLVQLYWVSENLSAVASGASDQRYLVFMQRDVEGFVENDDVVKTLEGAWNAYNTALQKSILLPSSSTDKALPLWTALYTKQQTLIQYSMAREAMAMAGNLNRAAVLGTFQDLYKLQKDLGSSLVLTFDGDTTLQNRQRFAEQLNIYLDNAQPTPTTIGLKPALTAGVIPPVLHAQSAINTLIGTWTGEVAFGFLKIKNPSSPRGTQLVPGDTQPFPFHFTVTNSTDKSVEGSLTAEILGATSGSWGNAVKISPDTFDLGISQTTGDIVVNVTAPGDAEKDQKLTLRLTATLPPPTDKAWTYDLDLTTAAEAGQPVVWDLIPKIVNRPSSADNANPSQVISIYLSTEFSAAREPTSLAACNFKATFSFTNSQRSDWGIAIQAVGVQETQSGVLSYSFPLPGSGPGGVQSTQVKVTAPASRGTEDQVCSFTIKVSGEVIDPSSGQTVQISQTLEDTKMKVTLKKL